MDLLPYILLVLLVGINTTINTRSSNNFILLVLFLFSALRYNVGFDYPNYHNIIEFGESYTYERFEVLEKILVLISRNTDFTQLFFIVNSFITVFCTGTFIKTFSNNVSISLLGYLCLPLFYTASMSTVRFATAIAILLYATTFLKNRYYLRFSVLYLLSLCFHKGAVVGLLFVPLFLITIPRYLNIIILLFGFIGGEFIVKTILSSSINNVYFELLSAYVQITDGEDGMRIIPYIFLALDLILYFLIRNKTATSNSIYLYYSIYNLGVGIMFLFSFETTLSIRLSTPFIIFLLPLLPSIVRFNVVKYKLIPSINKLLFWTFCATLFLYNVSIFNSELQRSQYLPYQLFFVQ